MNARERLTLAAALAVALGCACVVPLYEDLLWLPRALGAIAAVAMAGLTTRRLGIPAALQPLAALAFLIEYVCLAFVWPTLYAGLVPTGRTLPALRALYEAGLTDIARLAPPVPSRPGLTLIAVLGIGGVAFVVDLITVVLNRAALAGLPLLVLFAVPSAVRTGGLGWVPFTLGAAGWLSLLLVEGSDRVGRWGTPLSATAPDRGPIYDDTSLGRVGRRIGAAALGVAIVVPVLIPGLNNRLLGGNGGNGSGGDGTGTTTTYNPITRLRADLNLPTPREILRYTTDDKGPDYLRLTTLDVFADSGWSASRLTGDPRSDGVSSGLPHPAGLTSADTRLVHDRITITSLDAQWLPIPFPPRTVDVSGPWLYDRVSETVFGIRTGTRQLTRAYRVTATRVLPQPALLAAGRSAVVPAVIRPYAAVPHVTRYVRTLTDEVLAGQSTPYAKVAALQAFFTDPQRAFTYSTTTEVPGIDSPDALENFLRGRQGFCEQYASAMAAMIRLAGVPARVAVGFTPGSRQTDGSYVVTTSDAHAWPEAWFAGTGWVRFEPTPRSDGQADVPPYAQPAADGTAVGGPNDPLAPKPGQGGSTGDPSRSGVSNKLDRLEPVAPAVVRPTGAPPRTGRGRTRWESGLLGLPLLVALPGLLHVWRRRRRWHRADPLAGWQQVRDDAVDVGQGWRPADSPRAAASRLAAAVALPAAATEALLRVAAATEQVRYARPGSATADLPGQRTDAATVRAALLAGVSARVRWQARLLPASTLDWAASTSGTLVADGLDRFDDLWTEIRHRVRLGDARPS